MTLVKRAEVIYREKRADPYALVYQLMPNWDQQMRDSMNYLKYTIPRSALGQSVLRSSLGRGMRRLKRRALTSDFVKSWKRDPGRIGMLAGPKAVWAGQLPGTKGFYKSVNAPLDKFFASRHGQTYLDRKYGPIK